MDRVISELCYKRTLLRRNYKEITISWTLSYNAVVKFHDKNTGSHNMVVLFPIRVVTSNVIKGLHCITKVYAALRVLFVCMINVNIRSLTY